MAYCSMPLFFSVKLKADGLLDSYKARFVALGNHQEYDIDYN